MNEYVQLIEEALHELCSAGKNLKKPTRPNAPLPRPRIFRITNAFAYPHIDETRSYIYWDTVSYHGGVPYWPIDQIAKAICDDAQWHPRAILRALRRIQAATAWCRARAEGRQRAAQEILRQQRKSVEALEAEVAIRALGR